MQFCGTANCDSLFEGWSTNVAVNSAGSSIGTILIEEASAWIYSALASASSIVPSLALPTSGTSPDFWIRRATANEAIYLGLSRRMIASNETSEGYFDSFHENALGIVENILEGKIVLAPEIAKGKQGIGQPTGVINGTVAAPSNDAIETNALVAEACYTDDRYSRTFYVEITGSTTFQWWTNESSTKTTATISWYFIDLSCGVAIRFPNSSYTVGQKWQIECYPEREINSKGNTENTTYYIGGR